MTGSSGFGDVARNADAAQRGIDQWAHGLTEKIERYQVARAETEKIQLTEASADGAVAVTVGVDGAITDLVFSEKVRSFPLPEFSAQILSTMRRAQSGIAARVAETMAERLGDEDLDLRSPLLDHLRERFPGQDEGQAASRPVLGDEDSFKPW